MKNKFEELYKFMHTNQDLSKWAQQEKFRERALELKEEIDEMIVELDKKDWDKFRVELGDVFWDVLALIVKAEREEHLNVKDFLNDIHDKYKKRKPFLLENKSVSLDEEHRIWQEVKEQERNSN
jgi:NTP pyrophosphatase (non-canonical NTP hydrolase)